MMKKKIAAREVISLRERGFSYREAASELGISRMTAWRLANGVSRRSEATGRRSRKMELPRVEGDGPVYPDIDPEDKDALIARLQLENDILRGAQEVLKGRALGCSTNREKSLLIEWLRANTGRPLGGRQSGIRYDRRPQGAPRLRRLGGTKNRPHPRGYCPTPGQRGRRLLSHPGICQA
jgi:hypothetical protein